MIPIFISSHETDLARLLKLENAGSVLLSQGNLTKEDIMHFMPQKYGFHKWLLYVRWAIQLTQPLRQVLLVIVTQWPWSENMSQFFFPSKMWNMFTRVQSFKNRQKCFCTPVSFSLMFTKGNYAQNFFFPTNLSIISEEKIIFTAKFWCCD